MRQSLYDYCREHQTEELLQQWESAANGVLTPQDISYGSKQKVWWRCQRGHRWQAAVFTRTGGSGCPYCTGRRAWPGENDLASQRPELAAQWHPEKNRGTTPAEISLGSHYKAWWRCEKGHEWQAQVKSRVQGTDCPVCAKRVLLPGENDLAATHPELVRQWDAERNGTLTPRDVAAGTRKKVWWRCGKGHRWKASVASRSGGSTGCPVCANRVIVPGENDLASQYPAIAAQWMFEKNGTLTPEMLSSASNRKVWWRCSLGHSYQAVVAARTSHGSDCPYCTGRKVLAGFNDLGSQDPALAAQWHPELNGTLTAEKVTSGSHRKVWWRCAEGHVWKAVIYSRTGKQKSGCPVCAGRVKPEQQRYAVLLAEAGQRNVSRPI